MADRRGGTTSVGRGAGGRFIKITTFPDKLGPGRGSKNQGGYLITNTARLPSELVEGVHQRFVGSLLSDPDERAAAIQNRLRMEVELAYNRAATGRVSRGIFAKATKMGTKDGKSVETVVRVTMINYRETRFLTNLDGMGYFKHYPVEKYTIFAKSDLRFRGATDQTRKVGRSGIKSLLRRSGVGRLKVPRSTAFFTAARQPGRGGGESRIINDILGPASPGDLKSAFFFYPLWVQHPGFHEDVISEVALDEGARFQTEVAEVATESWSELRGGRETLQPIMKTPGEQVASSIIPLPGTAVKMAAESSFIGYARGVMRRQEQANYTLDETGRRIR